MTRSFVRLPALLLSLLLTACATTPRPGTAEAEPVAIRIIAFNDFHGYLAPPRLAVTEQTPSGPVKVPAGGAAYLASAIAKLRAEVPLSITVSAGDMTSASPLSSSLFLDEPTVRAMNLIGVDLNAVGNHEFDRGQDELLRLQNGGCVKFTAREPCQVDGPFPGAKFRYLAGNTVRADGSTLFPPYAIRSFTQGTTTVRIGFIGLTLKGTGDIVSPAGIKGIHFADEAATANALVPKLKAEGADIIVLLIHQGGTVTAPHGDQSCAGLSGEIVPIIEALDPAIQIVVSGHTHRDYVCDYAKVNPAHPVLLTSAGEYGMLLTAIDLSVDPVTKAILSRKASNSIVQGEPFTGAGGAVPLTDAVPAFAPDPQIAALATRYATAAKAVAERVVGRVAGPIARAPNAAGEQPLGDLIADAQLATMRTVGGAQLSFMNQGGVRADLVPGAEGAVTFGALYAVQPFGNQLIVRSYTGAMIRDLLEQQFTQDTSSLRVLLPSANLRYSYDLTKPAGARVSDIRLDGRPIDPAATYRVAISTFLSDGGDGFTVLKQGTDPVTGPLDLDALEAYVRASKAPLVAPMADRIRRLDRPVAP